jgi:hypothetical protein
METISKDFIDEAVERSYKKMLHRAELRKARINKKTAKRKMERQNRRKGRR